MNVESDPRSAVNRSSDRPLSITAIILSYNEETHIARCIARIQPLVDRIVVVDSFSTDRTVEVAQSLGAEILQHEFKNYSSQFRWGVEQARVRTDWILRLDCDEYLEPGLIHSLLEEVPILPASVTGLDFKLKVIFKGKFIRWGGYYNTMLTRCWRTGSGEIEGRWMDEHVVLASGERRRIRGGDLVDENLKDIGWWTDKHNSYATRQMIDFIALEHGLFPIDTRVSSDSNRSAKLKRFLRNRVFARTPLYLRSVLYFLQRYFLRLGFLDGKRGFVWHFLQGFWFFVLMDAKIEEAEEHIRLHGLSSFESYLKERYGISGLAPTEAP